MQPLAAWAFAAFLAVAFAYLLAAGRHYWFHADEWRLIGSPPESVGDFFRPENGHWSTLPILYYRVMLRWFGLESYLAFQVPLVLLNLALAVAIRAVMRRADVLPWVATVVASSSLLLGVAEQNLLSPIQVSMVGSVLLGYCHLLLLDHDGGTGRRDVLGLGCGVLALMSSGMGVVMIPAVATAALVRRGWRVSLLHGGILAAVFGIWDRSNRSAIEDSRAGGVEHVGPWVAHGVSGVFEALGHVPVGGVVLAAVAVAGLGLAWRNQPWAEVRRRAAVTIGLLASLVGLFVATALSRGDLGIAMARSGRYLGIGAAFALPAIGMAADAIVRRWRFGWLALAPLVLALPFNARDVGHHGFPKEGYSSGRVLVLVTAQSPCLDDAPPDTPVDTLRFRAGHLTAGELRELRDGIRLPDPPAEVDALLHAQVAATLGCPLDEHLAGFP